MTIEVADTAQEVEGESPEWGMHPPWWAGIDCLLGCGVDIFVNLCFLAFF